MLAADAEDALPLYRRFYLVRTSALPPFRQPGPLDRDDLPFRDRPAVDNDQDFWTDRDANACETITTSTMWFGIGRHGDALQALAEVRETVGGGWFRTEEEEWRNPRSRVIDAAALYNTAVIHLEIGADSYAIGRAMLNSARKGLLDVAALRDERPDVQALRMSVATGAETLNSLLANLGH